MATSFGDFIVFSDESGDHGLKSINPENPVFVLVFCIFRKIDYLTIAKQIITQLKLDYWGHDLTILHSREIRRSQGDFAFLFNEEKRKIFLNSLNVVIRDIPFSIIAAAIDKRLHKETEKHPRSPYLLALQFCLEPLHFFLSEHNQLHSKTHIVFESRGRVEDQDLDLAFKETIIQPHLIGKHCPFILKFADKKTNNCGLQIADLVAYPIARHVIDCLKPNKAFEIVREKLLGYPDHLQDGLKLYPMKNEMPQQTLRQDADRDLSIHS